MLFKICGFQPGLIAFFYFNRIWVPLLKYCKGFALLRIKPGLCVPAFFVQKKPALIIAPASIKNRIRQGESRTGKNHTIFFMCTGSSISCGVKQLFKKSVLLFFFFTPRLTGYPFLIFCHCKERQ